MSNEKLAPVHPGEVLLEEFLKPLGISQYRLADVVRGSLDMVAVRRIAGLEARSGG